MSIKNLRDLRDTTPLRIVHGEMYSLGVGTSTPLRPGELLYPVFCTPTEWMVLIRHAELGILLHAKYDALLPDERPDFKSFFAAELKALDTCIK